MSTHNDIPASVDSAIKREVGLGDNSGQVPEDFRISATPAEEIAPYLRKSYAEIVSRHSALTASAEAMPEAITSDVELGKAADLIKEIRLWDDRADSARTIEKEPFHKGGQAVDAFFKNMMDPLEKLKKKITAAKTEYSNAKLAAEKRRLAEEAEKKRLESERLAREAAQAEERRLAAEEAGRTADAAAQEARENQDEMEQGRLDAEAALAKAKLKKATARRDRDEDAFNSASAEVEQCQATLVTAKEKLRTARAEQKRLADEALKAQATVRTEKRSQETLLDGAVRAEAGAAKIENKLANATDGELVRERSELGSVSTLAKRWTCSIFDMRKVHENAALYIGLIDPDAIRVAIGKRMAAGNRDVPGVNYEQVSEDRSI